MATIKIFDGQAIVDVEVSEEFAALYAEMEHKEYLVNRKETRRHQSLDKSLEHGFEVWDNRVDVEEEVIKNEINEKLHNAIKQLLPQQQTLIKQLYFNDMTVTELAKLYGVSKPAICDRLNKIYAKLKNFYKRA